jgi:NADH-quinone oxidoreductase subunit E
VGNGEWGPHPLISLPHSPFPTPYSLSATMLTEEERQEIEAELHQYAQKRAVCIDALKIVQRRRGWVSDENLRDLAEFLEMTPDELDSVATFYNLIFRKPVGRRVILICDSVSCWIMGYDQIREHLTSRLGIELGETSSDGEFTMLPIACLGACDHAPALMIDEALYQDLEPQGIDRILERS